ncbi:AAA family ATPase [Devosia sp. BK]|uniref:AAA family ATPase n=1 Tax=Devosia sp. BK TaxID=2871706 RepID=UPI00293A12F9|nr:AAA family ATPase [Devosia sp. BK]MDV3253691.1 AAA family ATPase [Devosia sp. BK]
MEFSCLEQQLITSAFREAKAKEIFDGGLYASSSLGREAPDSTDDTTMPNSVGLAALFMLAAGLGSLNTFENAREGGSLTIIEVESSLWVPAVAKVLSDALRPFGRVSHGLSGGSFGHMSSYNHYIVVSAGGSSGRYLPRAKEKVEWDIPDLATIVEAISTRAAVYIVVPTGSDEIPPMVRTAADRVLTVTNPTMQVLSKLTHVFGASGPLEDVPAPEAIDPYRMAIAFRGRYEQQKISQLLRFPADADGVKNSSTGNPDALDSIHGMDTLKSWSRDLKHDLEQIAAGTAKLTDLSRGLLVSGPPGQGKTRAAKAIASFSGLPLFHGSVSNWLGTGGGHLGSFLVALRRAFASAAKAAPSLLVIDELDAIPARGKDSSFWDAAIAGLLEALDGLSSVPGVVVIGLCNRPLVTLDPALRRAGRFDHHLTLEPPKLADIVGMFRSCLAPDLQDLDFGDLAVRVLGCSYADVDRICKDARRKARRHGRTVALADIDNVLAQEAGGSEGERLRTATHEAGHALIAHVSGVPIQYISMTIARFNHGADGLFMADLDNFGGTMSQVLTMAGVALAGRAAEIAIFGEAAFGSSSDLRLANGLVMRALASEGLGGGVCWLPAQRLFSGRAPEWVLADTESLLQDCAASVASKIASLLPQLVRLRDALLDRHYLDASSISDLLSDVPTHKPRGDAA